MEGRLYPKDHSARRTNLLKFLLCNYASNSTEGNFLRIADTILLDSTLLKCVVVQNSVKILAKGDSCCISRGITQIVALFEC